METNFLTTELVRRDGVSVRQSQNLIFPDVATVGAMERCLYGFYSSCFSDDRDLTLDLSRCEFIEVSSLIYLISLIKKRTLETKRTTIRLPRLKNVRDFFRVWKFPKAVEKATGQLFRNLVIPEDFNYFGENKNVSDIKYASSTILDDKLERLLSARFFALTSFSLNRDEDLTESNDMTRMVFGEVERWEGQLIKAVLKKHLTGPEGYFSSRVIFESMTNALRHPKASIVQTVSRFDVSHKNPSEGNFTIAFWDDGDSIIGTLKKAIESGRSIKSQSFPELYKKYRVVAEDASGEPIFSDVVSAGTVPDASSSDELTFLCATFPGITRDTGGGGSVYGGGANNSAPDSATPGMGLYVLTNCVVDIFGGSVAFRARNLFMNIKRATHRDKAEGIDYKVKIIRYGSEMPDFLGNMLTIRLPIRVHEEQPA